MLYVYVIGNVNKVVVVVVTSKLPETFFFQLCYSKNFFLRTEVCFYKTLM